jgi:hypothetical protein
MKDNAVLEESTRFFDLLSELIDSPKNECDGIKQHPKYDPQTSR